MQAQDFDGIVYNYISPIFTYLSGKSTSSITNLEELKSNKNYYFVITNRDSYMIPEEIKAYVRSNLSLVMACNKSKKDFSEVYYKGG